LPRHPDFEKIYRQFMKRYCGSSNNECEKGKRIYYAWLNAHGLDDTKPYRKPQEAFKWAEPLIRLVKEDRNAKYYKVWALFPVNSMNRNVYTEEELIRAARTLIGKPVNMNHESPPIEGVEIIDAEYEDGAVEVLLKVSKNAMFKGKKIVDMIDNGEIMHVSVEGACRIRRPTIADNDFGFSCEGLVFTGLALLQKDVLPGVPLTRIEPVEKIVSDFHGDRVMNGEKKEFGEETEAGPRSDEDRAKAHFGISDEEWDKLSDEQKKALIAKLPPRGTAGKTEAENKEETKEREWDTAFINDLPDAAFAVIEPAYLRGETKDKRCRHLPHHGPDVKNPNEHESVDLPHLRNALARCNQIKPVTDSISAEELRRRAREHLLRHARALLPSYQDREEAKEKKDDLLERLEVLERDVPQMLEIIPRVLLLEDRVKRLEDLYEKLTSEAKAEETEEPKESAENEEKVEEKSEVKEAGETPKILTKEGFWERFRQLRKEGLSKSDAYRLTTLEVLEALAKQKGK